jgi:hypothetical protein
MIRKENISVEKNNPIQKEMLLFPISKLSSGPPIYRLTAGNYGTKLK